MSVTVMELPDHFFDRGHALKFLRHYLPQSQVETRIAVGFFTVRGYNLIRTSLVAPRIALLVGLDEPGPERVQQALVDEILRDLRTGLDRTRRQAVEDIVARLANGDLSIIDARAIGHHAKMYIIDDQIVLVGSFNLTGRGLLETIEAGEVVRRPTAVAYHTERFEGYFAEGLDITQKLLDALRRWLEFALPWHIYLKTLLVLESLQATKLQEVRPSYQRPTEFQRAVIARALRQIEAHRGAMVVASTGLGKTTIGTDIALRLHEQGRISNVLVLGPAAVEAQWQEYLDLAGINHRVFTYAALDYKEAKSQSGKVSALFKILDGLDDRWLILIDESHELRNRHHMAFVNRKLTRQERRAFLRLSEAVERSRCRVLLLTGTPYATEIENINNQLYLLPHTAPEHPVQGMLPLPGLEEFVAGTHAWQIQDLSEFRELEVGSVITTPYVAKYYGQHDQHGHIVVDFNGARRYLPSITLVRIDVPVLCEAEIVHLLDSGILRVEVNPRWFHIPHMREYAMNAQTRIERTVRIAWDSSPWALRDVLHRIISDEYRSKLVVAKQHVQQEIAPILATVTDMTLAEDAKLRQLLALLDDICRNGQQVIIFSEQQATVAYLQYSLTTLQPRLRVASLVRYMRDGVYELLPATKAINIIADFAPRANKRAGAAKYDVLLATDAYGVGVNLQDAAYAINYDLAWTPIEPAQRAGRVLRFRDQPQAVRLYTFYSTPSVDISYGHRALGTLRRRETLVQRERDAIALIDLAILPGNNVDEETIDLRALAHPPQERPLDLEALDDADLGVSSIFDHIANLAQHRDEAETIRDDIVSAMEYDGDHPLLFMLFLHQEQPVLTLYDPARKVILPFDHDSKILAYIACKPDTPTAAIDPNLVEACSDAAIQTWCLHHEAQADSIARICALYLKPRGTEAEFDTWLDDYLIG